MSAVPAWLPDYSPILLWEKIILPLDKHQSLRLPISVNLSMFSTHFWTMDKWLTLTLLNHLICCCSQPCQALQPRHCHETLPHHYYWYCFHLQCISLLWLKQKYTMIIYKPNHLTEAKSIYLSISPTPCPLLGISLQEGDHHRNISSIWHSHTAYLIPHLPPLSSTNSLCWSTPLEVSQWD